MSTDEPPEESGRTAPPGWNLGCAITCIVPVAAASAAYLLMWPLGDHPLGWLAVVLNGAVATGGAMTGPLFLRDEPLRSKVVGAVLSGVGGFVIYVVLLVTGVMVALDR